MPKITLEEFLKKNKLKAINCYTKEQAETVRKAFHEMGRKWSSGNSYLKLDYWDDYDTYRHYTNDGMTGTSRTIAGYTMYEFDDIIEFSTNAEVKPDPNQFRVLLRKDYKWHNACWDENKNRLTVYGNNTSQTSVLSVENDPRAKYVVCKMCGSVIKNTKKAIEEHAQLKESSKACLTCKSLRLKDEQDLKESFHKNEDGTYTQTRKAVCKLVCDFSYGCPSVDSDKARSVCRYRKCGAETIEPVEKFFAKYPGAFDDMATVDALDMSKWTVNYRLVDDTVELKRSGRYSIFVRTTSLGIVDRFICNYRSDTYEIVYSKKYDKLFMLDYGEYADVTSSNTKLSEAYLNELMKIVRNIYKGED